MSNTTSSDLYVSMHVPYVTCEVTVGVLAAAGNGLVLLVFWRERHLRRLTNYYIVALATADLLVGLLGVPMAILTSVGLPRQQHLCLLGNSVLICLCTISIFCLLAVSVDRYWAILHPLLYSRNMTSSIANGLIVMCWVLGTVVGMLPMMGWNQGWNDEPHPACLFRKVMDYDYLVFLYFATIIFPAILLAYFYAHIYKVVLRQTQPIQQITPHGVVRIRTYSLGPGTQLRQITTLDMRRTSGLAVGQTTNRPQMAPRREVRAAQNLSIIVLFFLLCWMPLYTINCVQAFCPTCTVPLSVMNFTIVLSHANSAVNPLLYAYHLRDFRAAMRALVFRRPRQPSALATLSVSRGMSAAAVARKQMSQTLPTSRPALRSPVQPTSNHAVIAPQTTPPAPLATEEKTEVKTPNHTPDGDCNGQMNPSTEENMCSAL